MHIAGTSTAPCVLEDVCCVNPSLLILRSIDGSLHTLQDASTPVSSTSACLLPPSSTSTAIGTGNGMPAKCTALASAEVQPGSSSSSSPVNGLLWCGWQDGSITIATTTTHNNTAGNNATSTTPSLTLAAVLRGGKEHHPTTGGGGASPSITHISLTQLHRQSATSRRSEEEEEVVGSEKLPLSADDVADMLTCEAISIDQSHVAVVWKVTVTVFAGGGSSASSQRPINVVASPQARMELGPRYAAQIVAPLSAVGRFVVAFSDGELTLLSRSVAITATEGGTGGRRDDGKKEKGSMVTAITPVRGGRCFASAVGPTGLLQWYDSTAGRRLNGSLTVGEAVASVAVVGDSCSIRRNRHESRVSGAGGVKGDHDDDTAALLVVATMGSVLLVRPMKCVLQTLRVPGSSGAGWCHLVPVWGYTHSHHHQLGGREGESGAGKGVLVFHRGGTSMSLLRVIPPEPRPGIASTTAPATIIASAGGPPRSEGGATASVVKTRSSNANDVLHALHVATEVVERSRMDIQARDQHIGRLERENRQLRECVVALTQSLEQHTTSASSSKNIDQPPAAATAAEQHASRDSSPAPLKPTRPSHHTAALTSSSSARGQEPSPATLTELSLRADMVHLKNVLGEKIDAFRVERDGYEEQLASIRSLCSAIEQDVGCLSEDLLLDGATRTSTGASNERHP